MKGKLIMVDLTEMKARYTGKAVNMMHPKEVCELAISATHDVPMLIKLLEKEREFRQAQLKIIDAQAAELEELHTKGAENNDSK